MKQKRFAMKDRQNLAIRPIVQYDVLSVSRIQNTQPDQCENTKIFHIKKKNKCTSRMGTPMLSPS